MLPTFVLATGVTTFILVIRVLFTLADLLIGHKVSVSDVGRVLLLGLPHIVVLTIPIGTLFAVLMTAARLSGDSELIALQACGIRLSRVSRPLLVVATVLFAIDLALTVVVLPRANRAFQALTLKLAVSGVNAAIEPGVFTEDFQGQLLYVKRIERDSGRWQGVLLFDQTQPTEERLVTAETGDLVINPKDGTAWLNLLETTTYVVQPDNPSKFQQTENRELRLFLSPPTLANVQRRLGVRETDSEELWRRVRNPESTREDRRGAIIELNKRAAIPAATLVFAALAFPLGIRNRRGGKGYGLTVSVLIVVVYYVLLNNGELLAIAGRLPAGLGVWLANIVLAILALALQRRVTQGFHGRVSLVRIVAEWLRRHTGRLQGSSATSRTPPGQRQRPRPRARCEDDEEAREGAFAPVVGIVDRLVLRQCVGFFVLVIIAVASIWIAVNFSEQVDDIHRNAVSLVTVVTYFAFSLPQILHDTLPLAFLIAFLGAAAVLERNNEATALKAAGVSLTRVALPMLSLGLALGVALFFFDESVVQRSNRAAQKLSDIINGKKVARSYRATYQQWLFLPDGHTVVNFLQYDPDTDTLLRPSIYLFDDDLSLRALYMAAKATYRDGKWLGQDAWSRTVVASASPLYVPHGGEVALPISTPPTYFGREYRKPSQMSFLELRSYIKTLRAAGYRVDRLRVRLYEKLSYPLSVLLLSWLALPFAFRMGRRGTVMGIGFALVLGMAYFALTAFVSKLGEASLVSPVLAAWTPTVVFALLAINRHTTLRT